MMMNTIKLTQFSPGAGCGCKISPAVLSEIIKHVPESIEFKKLIVDSKTCDDAAVFDVGNGQAIISTTDFFTPIVDDPYDFGRIAAANAISDVYAMGGTPLMAISILGWPLAKLSPEIAGHVVEGAVEICKLAGIPLAGGHSIDIADPVFGLSVTGIVQHENIKRNNTAVAGARLFLTKPLGIGILSTAAKKNILEKEDYVNAVNWMTRLNSVGIELGKMECVQAMTDVTGFGLLGHLLEICEGSGLAARISYGAIPKIDNISHYIEMNCIPGGTHRNWKSYGQKIAEITEFQRLILADPQTSGGLLIAIDNIAPAFNDFAVKNNFVEIGILEQKSTANIIRVVE
jgi:selenide,water dikinase